jgi:hypothetical protein
MGATALNIMLGALLLGLLITLIVVIIRGDDGTRRKYGVGTSIFDIIEKMTGRPIKLTHRLIWLIVIVTVLLGISVYVRLNAGGTP